MHWHWAWAGHLLHYSNCSEEIKKPYQLRQVYKTRDLHFSCFSIRKYFHLTWLLGEWPLLQPGGGSGILLRDSLWVEYGLASAWAQNLPLPEPMILWRQYGNCLPALIGIEANKISCLVLDLQEFSLKRITFINDQNVEVYTRFNSCGIIPDNRLTGGFYCIDKPAGIVINR